MLDQSGRVISLATSDGTEAGLDERSVLRALEQIWAEVLVRDKVNSDSDFFELGGDSVLATILMVRIEEVWGILVEPIEVFDRPRLEDFAIALYGLIQLSQGSIETEADYL